MSSTETGGQQFDNLMLLVQLTQRRLVCFVVDGDALTTEAPEIKTSLKMTPKKVQILIFLLANGIELFHCWKNTMRTIFNIINALQDILTSNLTIF